MFSVFKFCRILAIFITVRVRETDAVSENGGVTARERERERERECENDGVTVREGKREKEVKIESVFK